MKRNLKGGICLDENDDESQIMKRNLKGGICLDESSGESKICPTSASSTCQLSRSSLNTTKSSGVVSESMRVSGLSFCPIPEKLESS